MSSRYILDEADVIVVDRPTTETFHLQGEHDQQTHAGGRGSSIGEDVSLDDLDGEFVEAPAAEIVERFKLYDGDAEYETTSGARLYRAEDDRYVTLEEDDSGVYLNVHSDLYEVDVDVSDLETRIEESWREDVSRSIVYHGTRDGETAESIRANGLQIMNETRGLNNRWVGPAVYTSTEPELAGSYGQLFEVDLPRAIADGVIDPDSLSREPGFNEADAMQAVASSFDDYSFDAYGQFYGSGEDPQTVVIGAEIPPEYLKFDEDGSGAFSIEVFHLKGTDSDHDQSSHAKKNAAGESIADVGKTIPEDRSADAVLEEWMSTPEEFAAARALAAEKARNVPKPTAAQIAKNEAMLAKSKRPGGWGRGNSYTRRERGQALFEEFGGTPGGYCPCGHCGIKVSPRGEGGFAAMTQDKILTASEGGTYGTAKSGFPNLIPACGGCNASRNQASFDVRPAWEQEELPGLAASAGVTESDQFVAAEATGKPVGWDTWLDVEVGEGTVSGEYITRTVDVWFGPYTQHLIGGETCDPATIRILRDEFGADVWHPMVVTDPATIVQLHMRGRHDQQSHAGGALPDVPFSDVKIAYRPRHPDGKADPGEVVWAKVPFEERDGRAKDRPVLIIGRTKDGKNLVGVQLTSRPGRDRVAVGTGDWDRQGRQSYMDTTRFIQVDDVNYRREGAYMKKPKFQQIADVLTDRQNAPDVDLSVEQFHMAGQHDQQSHAGRGATGASIAGSVVARVEAGETITVSPSEVADVVAQFADQEGPMDLAAIDVEGYPNLFSGARANVTAREDMPQIPKAHLQQFREELEADGITVEEVQLNATELSATQRQLDAVKVAGVADAIRNGEFKVDHRIWVSHDNRILDGHHRWAAAAIVELEGHPASAPLDGYRVDMDMDALLVKARAYNEEHGVDARTYRAHMEALGLNPGQHFHLQGQHDQQAHAGDSAPADDYQGGHRPSETGPRIHDLLESEMTDGLDVYQNPHFFTGYAKAELDETMAQLRRVQGDPEANVTIYRAAPDGATINEGDWVSLSETYARLHADSGNAGDTPAVVAMEVPAKTVRWAVDDLMEYGYFPDLGEKRIFSEDDLAVETFHLQGQHDQQTHAGGRAVDPTSPAARRGWKPLKGVLSERPIEFDDYENRYRMTAANGQQIEAAVFTGSPETNEILRSPAWKQRIADGLNGVTDGYDLAPTDGPPPHIIVIDELPFGLPEVANQANAFVASRNQRGPVPFAAPFSGDQLQSNTVVFNATDTGREMWDVFEERAAEIMMPSVSSTSVAHYTGIHEYGHTRATEDGTPLLTEMYDRIRPQSLSSISPEWKQLSRYGKSNPAEAHAETFADFVLTGGQPTNAATAYYSSILAWGSDAAIEEALAAAAGTKLRDQWVWCIDSPYGGTLITKAPEGADFHLQGEHDQQTHGRRGPGAGVPDEFAQAGASYTDEAKAEWAAGAAYLAENEMPDWWAGLDYIGEDGLPKGRNEVGANYDTEDVIEKTEQFREEVGQEISAGIWMIGRAADARRKEVIAEAISTNQISPEDAKERWGYDADADRGEWQELPQTLYHATSAMGAISADGSLKTRREIGGRDSAAGLGGGTDNTISFTSDRAIADNIARSLHEAHRALNLPKDTFLAELRERSGSYWADVEEADRSLNGTRSWDTLEERFDLYRSFARVRERQEGILDPLFFNVNPETLRDMNPADIGIVEVMPAVTGAKGYQVSALGEWRTPTGAATEITRFIETDPVDQFTATVEDMRLKITRTTLASEDPTSLLARLRSGGDLTDAEARTVVDWMQSEVLTGDETPEEALVELLSLPIGGVEQFHANHDQSTHGNRAAGVAVRNRLSEVIAGAQKQSKSPAPQPLIEWRKAGKAPTRKSSRGIADWFRREFMPTGEVDVADMLLGFLTLPGRVLMPNADQERLLLAAQGMRVFHLQGQHDQQSHAGGGASTEFEPITAAEARGNSRPVTSDEFQRLAEIGRRQIDELAADTQPITALDENWTEIQQGAFDAAQDSWGGATIDARTGEFLASDADRYALTVKDAGFETVSVPEGATRTEFETAMTAAKEKFRPILERRDHYLGVFHDDDLGRIDFDPVTVVGTLAEVETIGAATRAIGGAYNFADGNGYWPPHVDDELAVAASAGMEGMDEKTSFKGPAEWKRQAKQLEGAPDAAPAPKKARKFRAADGR